MRDTFCREMSLIQNLSSTFSSFLHSVQTGDAIFYCVSGEADDERSLAYLLGLNNEEYSKVMGTLQIATFNKRFKKNSFSQHHLDRFLVNCSLNTFCATTQAQYKGKTRTLFLQIGSFAAGFKKHTPIVSPSDRQLPTVTDLKIKQATLRGKLCELIDCCVSTPPPPPARSPLHGTNERGRNLPSNLP
jgi:hypothetical protein